MKMRKSSNIPLILAAAFNVLFWSMIVNGYSLSSHLVGLPVTAERWSGGSIDRLLIPQSQYAGSYATAVVGSIAVISLCALIVKANRQKSPMIVGVSQSPLRASQSPLGARIQLLLFPIFFTLLLVFLALLSLPIVFLFSPVFPVVFSLGIILAYPAVVVFFEWVVSLVNEATLSKPVQWVVYTLQVVSLILVLTVAGVTGLDLVGRPCGATFCDMLCFRRIPSPNGQYSTVVEGYEDLGEFDYSRVFFDGPIFRRNLKNLERQR